MEIVFGNVREAKSWKRFTFVRWHIPAAFSILTKSNSQGRIVLFSYAKVNNHFIRYKFFRPKRRIYRWISAFFCWMHTTKTHTAYWTPRQRPSAFTSMRQGDGRKEGHCPWTTRDEPMKMPWTMPDIHWKKKMTRGNSARLLLLLLRISSQFIL